MRKIRGGQSPEIVMIWLVGRPHVFVYIANDVGAKDFQ